MTLVQNGIFLVPELELEPLNPGEFEVSDTQSTAPITIHFVPRLDEYLHAGRVNYRGSIIQKTDRTIAVCLFGLGAWLVHLNGPRPMCLVPTFLALLLWFNLFSSRQLLMRLTFKQNPKFREAYDVTFSKSGVHYHTPTSDVELNWSFYQRAVESDEIFMIYYAKQLYNVIPKRAFAPDELARFRALLKKRLQ